MKNLSKIQIVAIVISLVAAISVFAPWVSIYGAANINGQAEMSEKVVESMSGLAQGTMMGWIGLILSIIGGLLSLKQFKRTYLIGLLNVFVAILFPLAIFAVQNASLTGGSTMMANMGGPSVKAALVPVPQWGLVLFFIASLAFMIVSIMIRRRNRVKN